LIFKIEKHEIAENVWQIEAEKAHFHPQKGIILSLSFISILQSRCQNSLKNI
jgi:hypothetical protein